MKITREKFEELVAGAIENLPEKFKDKLYNVAIFVEDYPSAGQLKKLGMRGNEVLYGLFEGYAQAKRLNFGPVLPDRITIFMRTICEASLDEQQVKERVTGTVKHEIAHHFGSNESGARKASRYS